MKRSNSAHQLVMDSLTEALLQLMEKKKLSQISISELCEKAGVSRISFYRNYDYISDILTKYLLADLDLWWEENNNSVDIHIAPQDFWKELFSHLKKHERIIRLIYKSNESVIIKNIIFQSCGPDRTCDENEAFARAMLAGMIYGYTDEWIKRGMQDYPEELSIRELLSFLDRTLNKVD
ncbi:MAG: TetR/AcrR family transcriptional regulator [Erysipelotrichaceae bacterium]|nr:TetR/AcrR family transcriptional regulator [Erysipelotrichaceae bacterium]